MSQRPTYEGDTANGTTCISSERRDQASSSPHNLGLSDVLEALPEAIYTTDAKGLITFYNHAAAVLWGVSPALGERTFCGSWKLYWPDGTPLPHDECPMAMALK